MQEKLKKIKESALAKLKTVDNIKDIEAFRVETFGKKGEITQILKQMSNLSKEEKPIIGKFVNDVSKTIEIEINKIKTKLFKESQKIKLQKEQIDVTIPGKIKRLGNKHPMTQIIDKIKNIFIGMGYEIAEGPEIEKAYYNFEALNIPKNHPARDEQDTFYITKEKDFVLRTQTSPVQIRVMENKKLPIKIIVPGRVYRSDEVDATHSPVFHQLEGLVVDENITMGDLKATLSIFAKELFGEKTKVRFRPHHFPFTEPSAEMDATCFACNGAGCRICKNSGWIELLGCGMVHPRVLEMVNIDPEKYTGFAFGMGLERITMQKYSINDLRLMFENDVNFLNQF